MKRPLRVSWSAVAIAPLPIALLYSLGLAIAMPGSNPLLSFLFLFALSSVVSYGATVFLLLPCLFVLSTVVRPSAYVTAAVGTGLGCSVYVAAAWIAYHGSGSNSGPPEGSFADYLQRQGLDWGFWAFVVAGLATATLYWILQNRQHHAGRLPQSRCSASRAASKTANVARPRS